MAVHCMEIKDNYVFMLETASRHEICIIALSHISCFFVSRIEPSDPGVSVTLMSAHSSLLSTEKQPSSIHIFYSRFTVYN